MASRVAPLVSVVMPSFNQAQFIAASVESVLAQDHAWLELIVADGGSNDGTLDLLRQIAAKDARLRWFSAPDRGPADALNKAFKVARGTVFGWLNSDDLYTPGAISRALAALQQHDDRMIVYGHGQHIDALGSVLSDYPTRRPETPYAEFGAGCFICQPTLFMKRTAWVLLGDLDLALKAAFDFDYWMRAFNAFEGRIGFVDAVQAYSRLHGDCITVTQRRRVAVEGMRVLARHLGSAPPHWILTYINELLAQPALRNGLGPLRPHLLETLAEVADYLVPADRLFLQQQINSDARLIGMTT